MPTLHPSRLSDAAAIAALTLKLGYAADTAVISARLESLLMRDDYLVIVVWLEAQLAGWLQAHAYCTLESGHRVEIVGLIVADRCRRSGVGRALVRCAEDWAQKQAAETLVVRSNTLRTESHRFYPALGFTLSKTQTVYRKALFPPSPSRKHCPSGRPVRADPRQVFPTPRRHKWSAVVDLQFPRFWAPSRTSLAWLAGTGSASICPQDGPPCAESRSVTQHSFGTDNQPKGEL